MPLDTSIPLQIGRAPQVQALDPMTMYNAMQERQMNALRAQVLQQQMAQNALTMQNTMEDRRAAAAKAAQERAMLAQRKNILSQFGTTDAAIGQRGAGYSGTGVEADPYAYVRNKLVATGDLGTAEDIAKIQKEQLAGEESKAKIPGFKAESAEKNTKAIDARLSQLKSLAPFVDTDQGAAAFSKLVTQIVPEFAGIAGDPDEAAARNAAAFAKDPEAWRTQVSNLTAEQLVQAKERAREAAQPKPATLPPGAMSVDLNPQSPTYRQVIAKGGQTEQERKADVQTKQLKGSLNAAITSLEEMSKEGGLLDKATASGISALGDVAAGFVGYPTEGAIATGELQVLQDPILKMIPRFEGPQSDKDTLTYQQAAGQLANPNIPAAVRKAAAKTLIKLFKERQGQFAMPDLPEANMGAPANPFQGFIVEKVGD